MSALRSCSKNCAVIDRTYTSCRGLFFCRDGPERESALTRHFLQLATDY